MNYGPYAGHGILIISFKFRMVPTADVAEVGTIHWSLWQ